MSHYAELIAVGTELLLGNVANTDAQYVSEKLAAAGVDVLYHTAVGDNPRRLRQVTDVARSRCNLLIFIGGLGPTYDDLTKEIVRIARHIGTFDTSILPYEDCCTVFTPRHPKTKPHVEEVREIESVLDIEGLVQRAMGQREVVKVKL